LIKLGASAGIGQAIAWQFAERGSKLVLIGRRSERLEVLKTDLLKYYPLLEIHTIAMSVTDLDKVSKLPVLLPESFRSVDILVNNAGLALGTTSVDGNSTTDAKIVLETNVLGVIAMCSTIIPGMKERGGGHVINIGSVAGHHAYATGSVYNASKFAVNGFTLAARHDLAGTPIRVTHISPGLVGSTEFSNVRLQDDVKAAAVYENMMVLQPEDVADNVIYAVRIYSINNVNSLVKIL
jgi:NADP-dependent 3-hydroxy acid dehydrogenase YdfG